MMTDQDQWVEDKIASGEFANKDALVQDLIDQAIKEENKHEELRAALQEGLESGVSNRSVDDITHSVIKRYEG